MIFVDIETNGLSDEITETAILRDNEVEEIKPEEIYTTLKDDKSILTWHPYISNLLKLHNIDSMALTDYLKLFINDPDKLKIINLTRIFTGRDHTAKAKQDVIDLKDTYNKLSSLLLHDLNKGID